MLLGTAPEFDRLRVIARDPATATLGDRLLAAWDFSDGIEGTTVLDRGPYSRHGRTVNLPARGVTGHSWDGSVADWRHAPGQYGAIHFHEDDLHDCGWSSDVAFEIPGDWKSGFYAARMRVPGAVGYVAFFVRPRRGEAGAPIALVASTATYMSYANTHIKFDSLNTENLYESLTPISEDELYLNEHRELGLSHYDTHSDGSGVFYASRLRPMLNFRPGLYTFNYLNDTHIVAWLAERGFECDVITDEDIHEEGEDLLSRYRVVITGSHPEYTSTAMWDAFDAYQRAGGRHMYLGGNGFLLAHRIQQRDSGRHREPAGNHGRSHLGGRAGRASPLVHRGEPGGPVALQRPPAPAAGGRRFQLDAVRSLGVLPPHGGGPRPRSRYAFVFEGIGDYERIGDFGLRGGGAAGMEIDRCDAALGTPVELRWCWRRRRDVGNRRTALRRGVRDHYPRARRRPERTGPRRHGVLRDAGGRGRLVHRLHRLGDLARLQRLRQQRLAHHRERAAAIPGSASLRGAGIEFDP